MKKSKFEENQLRDQQIRITLHTQFNDKQTNCCHCNKTILESSTLDMLDENAYIEVVKTHYASYHSE